MRILKKVEVYFVSGRSRILWLYEDSRVSTEDRIHAFENFYSEVNGISRDSPMPKAEVILNLKNVEELVWQRQIQEVKE